MSRAEVNLTAEEIKTVIVEHYGLPIQSLQKVRAIYKVVTPYGSFGFKNAEELPDLPAVVRYLEQIRQQGYARTPRILLTNRNECWMRHLDQSYFMEEWLPFAEVPKESFPHLETIGRSLAHFHRAAKGIVPAPASHRFEWGKRKPFLSTALHKIAEWKQRTSNSATENAILDFLHYRCRLALEYMKDVSPDALLAACPDAAVLCHGGLHHKNILIDRQNLIWFIDFETIVYTERVMDLAQLLQYHANPYHWHPRVVNQFLTAYGSQLNMPIRREEWRIFLSYLAFPRRFHNRMLRYFDNQERPRPFLLKLTETMEQDMAKETFLGKYKPGLII